MLNSLKNLFHNKKPNKPDSKLIDLFEKLNSKDKETILLIHLSLVHLCKILKLQETIDEIWMKHYTSKLSSNDMNNIDTYLRKLISMGADFDNKFMIAESISIQQIILYFSCQIPSSENILQKQHAQNVFNHFRSYGEINFNPPPKNRKLLLD